MPLSSSVSGVFSVGRFKLRVLLADLELFRWSFVSIVKLSSSILIACRYYTQMANGTQNYIVTLLIVSAWLTIKSPFIILISCLGYISLSSLSSLLTAQQNSENGELWSRDIT